MGTYWRSKPFSFHADEFIGIPSTPLLARCPAFCEEHVDPDTYRPVCFTADQLWYYMDIIACEMRLITPIDINSIMPGQDQKILTLGCQALKWADWGTQTKTWDEYLRIYGTLPSGDEELIFNQRILGAPGGSADVWRDNLFVPNLDISAYDAINIAYYVVMSVNAGGIHSHVANLTMDCEYYVDVPPDLVDVTITALNRETSERVSGARVRLMAGPKLIADGYTDGGSKPFNNIDEGSYRLIVEKGGFESHESTIDVVPPAVMYDIRLTPIPVPPLPWWTWYLVGGIGVVGALTILPTVLKRERPIYVVK